MERYVCVHGHFYQPPRENPWLESIELQDSAYPYHDWNERITAECYGPNGTSRILDDKGRIWRILNNYARISFNFGPTLLSWMEEKAPLAYRAIFEADQQSQDRFSGHGSALAQAYNHIILPLANKRDKFTQVYWGLQDFEFRFGRRPEGMWLPETAVDLETLDIMAELGIKFTILAPHQAKAIRQIGTANWHDLNGGGIDPTRAYKLPLPSGHSIAVFFYDGPISRAIAFERLLERGENLVNRFLGAFSPSRTWPQLVHIATDGETYGHHHRHGDMALAYALNHLEGRDDVKLTNYGEFLEKFPPTHEAQINENSSWSCAHGVERWRSDCGCNAGGKPGWNQAWRKPLREALDWLRDTAAPLYEQKAAQYLKDPWMTRNDYVELLFDRSTDGVEDFLANHATRALSDAEKTTVLKLLELQRQTLYMYTSCGWFFDEISGIEAVQVLRYAGRALQLLEQLFEKPFESEFLARLELAKSNVPDLQNGRRVYEKFVKPVAMNLQKVTAHYAISSLFVDDPEEAKRYCYAIDYKDYRSYVAGKARLVVGWVRAMSEVTWESDQLSFAILHLGDHNLSGGVTKYAGNEAYMQMMDELVPAFKRADFTEAIRAMDHHFGASTYSLKSLFRDEQRRIVGSMLETTLTDSESELRRIYEDNAPLMRFLADLSAPLPRVLLAAAEFSINMSLKHAIQSDDAEKIAQFIAEAKESRIPLDEAGLAYAFEQSLTRLTDAVWDDPSDAVALAHWSAVVALAKQMPFEVNLWNSQNSYYELFQRVYPEIQRRLDKDDQSVKPWIDTFRAIGQNLRMALPTQ